MAITVKRLIEKLQEITNKHLEVECYVLQGTSGYCEIGSVGLPGGDRKKVLIFTRENKGDNNE